ncbi:hypothetical protein HMPREF1863_00106 [Aedoeadaptatus coxii]|uniref:Uncharacterized protein n=1 Tax=Aedoeadaptatus coxii TaxID=755172 RepID=A0A134AL50_9FIRM|nr:hypothetical protein HMPREF1863_00106 [Peptoniphilus coxii]
MESLQTFRLYQIIKNACNRKAHGIFTIIEDNKPNHLTIFERKKYFFI